MPVASDLRGTSRSRNFKDDIPLNHATVEMHDQFKVALFQMKEHPTPEQIAANKVKWGMDPNAEPF